MVQVVESFTAPGMMSSPGRRIVDADGIQLKFSDGRVALCATSGLWNVPFGYGNTTVAEHMEQPLRSLHYGTLFRYSNDYADRAAQLLVEAVGDSYQAVIFGTSGSALNDAAVKFARQRAVLQGKAEKRIVVTFRGSYHGMTLSSMALSGERLGQAAFSVDIRFVRHLSLDDPEEWEHFFERFGNQVALVMLEPMLGSGVFEPTQAVLRKIAQLRDEYDFLLMADEVATGFYKLGTFAASMQWPRMPDLIGFSKALTNGAAASSMLLVSEESWSVFLEHDCPFMHGETQAGSPLSAAATIGVFDFMSQYEIEWHVQHVSEGIAATCANLEKQFHLAHRGRGLFHFLGWGDDAWWKAAAQDASGDPIWHIVDSFREHGVVVQPSIHGIQIIPQIVTTDAEMCQIGQALSETFEQLERSRPWK
ncbi:aminotransferase class III-fold pyridoxal phosphate-dependent enzyme [Pseudoscardovia suis]|uniref:aminotransferase class III-fold pyridoxal phosphate-dependent enzyme n=1 Tax=Pseudoscardovia suis TaxID=987063 RepID=UPI0012FF2E6F|nr:aminotransferase class III-fold pyridoxal phosphate-dependent enzyme [Pseudoscardovia suis]